MVDYHLELPLSPDGEKQPAKHRQRERPENVAPSNDWIACVSDETRRE